MIKICDRTFKFSLLIIKLYKHLNIKHEYILSKQLLKSGTSIGANVEEAQAAQSRKDFIQRCQLQVKKPEKVSTGFDC